MTHTAALTRIIERRPQEKLDRAREQTALAESRAQRLLALVDTALPELEQLRARLLLSPLSTPCQGDRMQVSPTRVSGRISLMARPGA